MLKLFKNSFKKKEIVCPNWGSTDYVDKPNCGLSVYKCLDCDYYFEG